MYKLRHIVYLNLNQKHKKMKNIQKFTTIVVLAISFFGPINFIQGTALAVEPGCYTPQPEDTFIKTECPTENVSRAVSQFKTCFVVNAASSYAERDCDDLSKSSDKVPEPSTTAEDANDGDLGGGAGGPCEEQPLSKDNCTIIKYIVIAINFLSAVAMMAIIGSVMFAGFQYMTARDNPQAVAAAKTRIVWALVALLLFVFGYGLLNFLVPGGVL